MRLIKKLSVLLFCITLFYSCSVEELEDVSQQETINEIFLEDVGDESDDFTGEDDTPKDNEKGD